MSLLDWLNSPYSSFAHRLPGREFMTMRRATYKIAPGQSGVPMVQLDLQFSRMMPPVANPDMTLAVLIDRSGSMQETFAEGHVYNACSTILQYVQRAGVGFDMAFYSDGPSFAGHIANDTELRTAIMHHQPRGGTVVTSAIKGAIERYRKRDKGIYLIVVTDGEFQDKLQVEQYVQSELLPLLRPETPYALRLHFIGAGHGVDHAFLTKMENLATGQGVPLVTAHHHAHLSHAHEDVLDELEGAFMGIGTDAMLGAAGARPGGEHHEHAVVTRVGDLVTRVWHPGEAAKLGFLPKRSSLGLEYALHHPSHMPIELTYRRADASLAKHAFKVPLPRQLFAPGSLRPGGGWLARLVGTESEEQREAREELEAQIEANAKAEAVRQTKDLQELGKGGIPVQARERLKEFGKTGDEEGAIFTSNLSPDEMALLRRNGYRARGLVMGSAMYHVGQAYASSQGDCEVTVLSDAYNRATELAVNRMAQELQLIGAHGVIGVRLAMARHEWGEKSVEVQVMGTAIEGPGKAPAKPWMSDLSGQEWFALHRAGYDPVALVWGHCTWFCLTSLTDEQVHQSWTNQEFTHWSTALSQARNRAMAHVRQQATELHAVGVTGMRIERRIDEVHLQGSGDEVYKREHHNLILSITGTAIRVRDEAPRSLPQTRLVLSLRDGALRSDRIASTSDVALEEEL